MTMKTPTVIYSYCLLDHCLFKRDTLQKQALHSHLILQDLKTADWLLVCEHKQRCFLCVWVSFRHIKRFFVWSSVLGCFLIQEPSSAKHSRFYNSQAQNKLWLDFFFYDAVKYWYPIYLKNIDSKSEDRI